MNKPTRRRFLGSSAASSAAFLLAPAGQLPSGMASPPDAAQSAIFSVREYGAKGDKVSNDTPALQAAIDACNRSGGGEVLVPPGDYFAGGINLKSNVTFRLQNGATIWASGKFEDYSSSIVRSDESFLFEAVGQENIVICGDGKVVGTGQGDLLRRKGEVNMRMPRHRFGTLSFVRCKNVRFRNFGIRYSEAHTLVLTECDGVFVDGISILNSFFHTETDGIDPDSCKNVLISNCHIIAGDDAICLKADQGKAVENVVVSNCVLESIAGAIKFGTGSSGDFRNIRVSNCVIRNSGVGVGMFIKDGGTVEGASFSNLSIETTRKNVPVDDRLRNNIFPIYIDLTKRNPNSPLSHIRDVSFNDIQIASDNSVVIQGMPQSEIENLTLRGINFRVNDAFDFSHRTEREGGTSSYSDENFTRFVRKPTYLALAHINGFSIDGVRMVIPKGISSQFPRSAVGVFNSQDGVIRNVTCQGTKTPAAPPLVDLQDCHAIAFEHSA